MHLGKPLFLLPLQKSSLLRHCRDEGFHRFRNYLFKVIIICNYLNCNPTAMLKHFISALILFSRSFQQLSQPTGNPCSMAKTYWLEAAHGRQNMK